MNTSGSDFDGVVGPEGERNSAESASQLAARQVVECLWRENREASGLSAVTVSQKVFTYDSVQAVVKDATSGEMP